VVSGGHLPIKSMEEATRSQTALLLEQEDRLEARLEARFMEIMTSMR